MSGKPITILVVDDEERIRKFAKLVLEADSKMRVVGEADNGKAATDLAKELNPDVVIMDISMPIMNGLDAARAILRECPQIHIIMTSAMGADPYQRISRDVGADCFIEKSSLDAQLIPAILHSARHGPH